MTTRFGIHDDEFAGEADEFIPEDDFVYDFNHIYRSVEAGVPLKDMLLEIEGYFPGEHDWMQVMKEYRDWLEDNKPDHWNTDRHLGAVNRTLRFSSDKSSDRITSYVAAVRMLSESGLSPEAQKIILDGYSKPEDYRPNDLKFINKILRRREPPPLAPPPSPSPDSDRITSYVAAVRMLSESGLPPEAQKRILDGYSKPPDMDGRGRAAKSLRPPICRIGTKKSLLDKVFKAFPADDTYDTYVEPFVGGGAVYWAKDPSKREVINDLDSELIELYRILKTTRSRDFRTDLTSQPAIQTFFSKGKPKGEAAKLQYGIVGACNRWMGRQTGSIIYKDADPHNKTKNIDSYQERMKGTIILNESYEKVIHKYDSPRTFFYLDPPYENSGKLYKANEDTFDFIKLRDELKKIKGKFLLSINDSKNIRDLFKGYYAKGVTVKGVGKGLGSIASKDRKELLIANYAF